VPLAPVEIDPLAGHLLALLAHLLALSGGQCIEKVLKIAIASVKPVELAPQSHQPGRAPRQQIIGKAIGEVEVQSGQPLLHKARLKRLQ
jgi:hypothetical protein